MAEKGTSRMSVGPTPRHRERGPPRAISSRNRCVMVESVRSACQNILVFVDKQEAVDSLFRQLIDAGYPCLALHGGMDQSDRDFTVADFKVR